MLELRKGALKITPFDEKNVGECSVDLTLGKEFRKLKRMRVLEVEEKIEMITKHSTKETLTNKQTLTLKPNELILGITEETIKMPEYLCGWIQGRSRFARIGLMVHISSSLIQPGVENRQVLEIVNLSPNALVLRPGLKICQVVFEKLTSPARHRGVFSKQQAP